MWNKNKHKHSELKRTVLIDQLIFIFSLFGILVGLGFVFQLHRFDNVLTSVNRE